MIYKLELDAQSIQVIGEALAIAPLAARMTQPVLQSIQQQINTQEQIAKAVAETHPAQAEMNHDGSERIAIRRGRKPKQNGAEHAQNGAAATT